MMFDADLDVAFGLQSLDGLRATEQRDAAAGTMPSSTAALVACMASSTRAFFSFISVSVAADLMTATRPRAWPTALQLLAVSSPEVVSSTCSGAA